MKADSNITRELGPKRKSDYSNYTQYLALAAFLQGQNRWISRVWKCIYNYDNAEVGA